MKKSKKLTQKRLKELLHYNPETGIFIWKINRQGNKVKGNEAGWIDKDGYKIIRIDYKNYRTHRLAWFYKKGYFPENEIDHINRIKTDNRWKNLREISRQCNSRNSGNYITNTSGIKGVYWDTNHDKWIAQLWLNNKLKRLGGYKNFDNAVCARLAAEQCLNWGGCDNNSPAYNYVQKMLKKKKLPKIII
jgi:hypothetical protein